MNSIDCSMTGLIAVHQALLASTITASFAGQQLDASEQQHEAAASLLEGTGQLSNEIGESGTVDSVP